MHNSQSIMSAVWERSISFTISNTVQGDELGRCSVVVMVDKHCYHTHGQFTAENTHQRPAKRAGCSHEASRGYE